MPAQIARATASSCSPARTRARRATSCEVHPEEQRVIVEGVNIVKKHQQAAGRRTMPGGIIDKRHADPRVATSA